MWDFFCIVARKTCNDLEQITSGVAMVKPKDSTYPLQYNSGSPRFKLYNEGSQGDCEISMHIHAYICMRAFHKIHTRKMTKILHDLQQIRADLRNQNCYETDVLYATLLKSRFAIKNKHIKIETKRQQHSTDVSFANKFAPLWLRNNRSISPSKKKLRVLVHRLRQKRTTTIR